MNPANAAPAGPVLRDIHLPPAPGWFPPAPGWWLLAAVVMAVCICIFVYARRTYRQRHYRRALMAELDRCIGQAHGDPSALAAALSRFLRRLSRQTMPAAATLAGERWLEHLDACAATNEFTSGVGRILIEAPYRAAPAYDTAALIALVRRWVRGMLDRQVAHA
jgi:hypothetical protein